MVDNRERSFCYLMGAGKARSLPSQCTIHHKNGSQTIEIHFRIAPQQQKDTNVGNEYYGIQLYG